MSIGNKPAFAAMKEYCTQTGMTYRQWLIGQALVGLCVDHFDTESIAACSIKHADTIIAKLDAEEKNNDN